MHPIVVEQLERLVRPFYGNIRLHVFVACTTKMVELVGQLLVAPKVFLS